MGKARLIPFAIAVTLGLSLCVDAAPGAVAAQRGNNACVAISGGLVSNETVLDVVADGGTAISDSSGGQGNIAARADNNRNRNNNNNNNNNNNRRNRNRNNWSSEPLSVFETRLQQTDTASAGNAGVANASANGGVVSIGDVNSGGNSGNAISVGDTHCPGAAPSGGHAGGNAGGGGRGGQIRALPSTGVGADGSSSAALLCALSALGFAGLSLRRRFDLGYSRLDNR